MIKDNEVNIKIVGRNLNYYRSLNYKCKAGDNILVKVNDVQKNSHIKITAICDRCGKEKIISLYAYNKNFKNYNTYYCNDCKQIKIEKTNIKKYGCKRPIQNKEIHEKLEKTNEIKFGVKHSTQNINIINKVKNQQINTLYKKYNFLNIKNIKYGNCTIECEKSHIYDINFSLLNLRIKYKTIICTICNPISSSKSGLEILFKDFFTNNYSGEIIYNNRTIIPPYELDIYLPEINIAFEFNGIYWHNNFHKPDNYHTKKLIDCEKKNIKLIHIWEDEWLYNEDEIKKNILKILNNEILFDDDIIKTDIFMINEKTLENYKIIKKIKPVKYTIKNNRRVKFNANIDSPYIVDCGKIVLKKIKKNV